MDSKPPVAQLEIAQKQRATPGENRPLPVRTRGALSLVQRLAEQLNESGLSYCLWKGSPALDQVLVGEKDIDLLLNASDAPVLWRILSELGFREAIVPDLERLPATADFFGLDDPSQRIVHVHLHERLVIGHPLKGAYRLPIEDAYLSTVSRESLFPTPQPEFEFIVFVMRMILEERRLSQSRIDEYQILTAQVSPTKINAILSEQLPFLGPTLFEACRNLLENDSPRISRIMMRRKLTRILSRCGLRRPTKGRLSRFWYRARRAIRIRLLQRRPLKRRMSHGGAMVALIGGDGAGKSTAISHLKKWLAEHFDVRVVHLGKPPRSFTTRAVRASLRLIRVVPLLFGGKRPANPKAPPISRQFWHFCTARDRYREYVRCRQRASRGEIVIFDRLPMPDVIGMDGPQISDTKSGGRGGYLFRLLARCEKRWLDGMGQTDLTLVLKVDPDLAVRRKPNEEPDFVRHRAAEVWHANWEGTGAEVVDANQPLKRVLSQLKPLIWSSI